MKKALKWFFAGFSISIIILVWNTLTYQSQSSLTAQSNSFNAVQINYDRAISALSQSLKLKTISSRESNLSFESEFAAFHSLLREQFPRVHEQLNSETISTHSLLFRWEGKNPSLKPTLMMAHIDVVPADENSKQWKQPPFSGSVIDGYIWGRGALDNKSSLIAILTAVETLLEKGFTPQRTVYIALGHDEEIGGTEGNLAIANYLKDSGVTLSSVIDEGFFILDGMIPGIDKPVAMVGIAEKGFLTLKLSVQGIPGHSASPPPNTTIGLLSKAIANLESNPLPGGLDGVAASTFEVLGAEMPFMKKLIFANLWLFKPVVEAQMLAKPSTNALLRTTTAVTMIGGGIKENVLPQESWAVVNFRISPNDSIDKVIHHVNTVINDDRVKVSRYGDMASEPSKISSMKSPAYDSIRLNIQKFFPEALIAPANVVGATDSRHYESITENTYRFMPIVFNKYDISRFHGLNERISVDAYKKSLHFYTQLIQDLSRQ